MRLLDDRRPSRRAASAGRPWARRRRSRARPSPRPRRSPWPRAAAPLRGCSRRSGRPRRGARSARPGSSSGRGRRRGRRPCSRPVRSPARRPGRRAPPPSDAAGGGGGSSTTRGVSASAVRAARRGAVALQHHQHAALRHAIADRDAQLADRSGRRGGNVHRGLIGLERDQRVLGRTSSPGPTRISMTGTSVKSPMSGTRISVTAGHAAGRTTPRPGRREAGGGRAVDHPVIVGERQRHHQPRDELRRHSRPASSPSG